MAIRLLPHSYIIFLAAMSCVLSFYLLWPRRNAPGGKPLLMVLASVGWWTLCAAIESAVVDTQAKILWSKLEYVGLIQVSSWFLLFALQYNRKALKLPRAGLLALWALPVISLALVWTNEWHGWIWPDFHPGPPELNILIYGHGPAFYMFGAYQMIFMFASFVILARYTISAGRLFFWQGIWMIIGSLIPTLGGLLYILGITEPPGLDWSPIAASVTGFVVMLAQRYLLLFDLVPVAQEAVIEQSQDVMVVIDTRGRILRVNPAAIELLGKDSYTLVGKPVREFPPLDKLLVEEFLTKTGLGLIEKRQYLNCQLASPSGPTRYFEASITPLRDLQNVLYGAVLTLREVTILRQARESARVRQEQLQHLIDGAPWRAAILDARGKYRLTNTAYAAFFGLTPDDLNEKYVTDVFPGSYSDQISNLFKGALSGKPIQHEMEVNDNEGAPHTFLVSCTPFFSDDGQVNSISVYALDITEQKEKEANFQYHQALLEEEVRKRTEQLETAICDLENEIAERQRAELELRKMEENLVDRITSQSRKLAGLYEVIIAGSQAEEVNQVLDNTLERALAALEGQAMSIHEFTDGDEIHLVAQRGLPSGALARMGRLPRPWFKNDELPALLGDLSQMEDIPAPIRDSGFGSYLAAPIRQRGKIMGILGVFWRNSRGFSVEDISLASAVAEEFGVILENIDLRKRIEEAIIIKERRRLARDLHDSVTQSLHSLVLAAHAANNRLKQGNLERLEESLGQLSEGARQALKEMRLLLYEMRLVPLQEVNMLEAIQTRIEMVEQRAGVEAHLEVEEGSSWPKAWEGDLFCIVVEALNNSLKYSQASNVQIRLSGSPEALSLQIQDNGCGFDPAHPAPGGQGLKNMVERAERLGGKLRIDSGDHHGVLIAFESGVLVEEGVVL